MKINIELNDSDLKKIRKAGNKIMNSPHVEAVLEALVNSVGGKTYKREDFVPPAPAPRKRKSPKRAKAAAPRKDKR